MFLYYFYGGEKHRIFVDWTGKNEQSFVFQELVYKLMERHGDQFSKYSGAARGLDEKVDKLYQLIYIYNDEHHAIPYNPKFRGQLLSAYSTLSKEAERQTHLLTSDEVRVMSELFSVILDKLQEIVGVYLLDNAYQGKHRYRRKNLEEWAETTDESRMSYEFESVLLQMTDLSRTLNRLTETQRRRLVKHILLNFTLQEIADQEHVSKQSIEESVASALKKLRPLL